MLEFGASFRKSRESLNLTIDKVAAETRISTRFLEAIENERFDLLPGGIFNRGFIRAYAVRLGLDPEDAIQGYEKLFRTAEAEPAHQEVERVRGKTTKIPVYYVALVGLLILIVVFYFLTRHTDPPQVTESSQVEEVSAQQPPAVTAPQLSAVPGPDATPVVTAAVPPTPAVSPASPVAAQAPAPSNAPVVLELEVMEESWFKLSSDGSDVVSSELLAPGTVRRYAATNTMNVSIGNAAGVALRVNGQQVSSLGRSGQVRNMIITPNTSATSLNVR